MRDGHLNKCAECVRVYVRQHAKKNPLRKVWQHMIDRCDNQKNPFFHRYGGRGISVCDRWRSYDAFVADMGAGYSPGLTIERLNNDGDYEPRNCAWVTLSKNIRNSTTATQVTAFGRTQCIAEWAEETGINAKAIEARLNKLGWTPERAVSEPLRADSRRA